MIHFVGAGPGAEDLILSLIHIYASVLGGVHEYGEEA